jgi:hypothetical protein
MNTHAAIRTKRSHVLAKFRALVPIQKLRTEIHGNTFVKQQTQERNRLKPAFTPAAPFSFTCFQLLHNLEIKRPMKPGIFLLNWNIGNKHGVKIPG